MTLGSDPSGEIRAFFLSAAAQRGVLSLGGAIYRCSFGRAGIAVRKREGDGATPMGRFALGRVFFRPDRGARPQTALTTVPLSPALGWCEDPSSPEYNRLVRLPSSSRHERMWRDDPLYDICVEIAYNDAPVLKGRGSAIFLHLARPGYAPTEGCIAVNGRDMRRLLSQVSPGAMLRIG
ncbi:MAG: L,D-transpeptidase family protein [Hyphomicrobiales bacterium]|nr:L,D-transpeptidase family protein [Hyphomicrobiales bacterium]